MAWAERHMVWSPTHNWLDYWVKTDMQTALRNLALRRPLTLFYSVVFCISWLGVFALALPGGIPATPDEMRRLLPLGVAAMLLGPTVAGLWLTWLTDGSPGLRKLWHNLMHWKIGALWYLIALFLAPALMLSILAFLSKYSASYVPGVFDTPDMAALISTAIIAGIAAGVFEELGWTGFAFPKLRRNHSLLATGLIMGFLWGAWHYPVNFWGSGDSSGDLDLQLLLPALLWSLLVLPAYRLLMVWVHDRTGSLPCAMLMHSSLTGSMIAFNPLDTQMHLAFSLVFSAVLIILAIIVLVIDNTQVFNFNKDLQPGDREPAA